VPRELAANLWVVARKARISFPRLTYHVWANAVSGHALFRDDVDKDVGLAFLREEVELSSWTCLAYVLMSTHYHVLLRPRKATLSSGFLRFNLRYAQHFNKRHDLRGHVFARRFESKVVEGPFGQLEVSRYIALNPTKAKMCDWPEDYPWSSYGATAGLSLPDGIVDLKAALAPLKGSRAAFHAFVAEGDVRERRGQVRA
jgi:hypothetical protein